MNLSIDKLIHRGNSTVQPLKSNNRKADTTTVGKKFDEVMISSSESQIKEKKITEALEKNVLSQIQAQPSKEDLEALKQSVADGTYEVKPEEIASRILLGGGL